MEAVSQTGTFPYNYTPISEPEGLGDFPEYLAIYVQAGTGSSANDTTGWHVFQDANVVLELAPGGVRRSLGRRGQQRRRPAGHGADDEPGVCRRDAVTAPAASGSGGTDSWTAPGWL